MDAAYSRVVERGLLNRALVLDENDVHASTTPALSLKLRVQDPVVARVADLRSGVPRRTQSALASALRLLVWDASFEWARAFLLRHAHRAAGQLVDSLLDPEQDVAVRRPIPQIPPYTGLALEFLDNHLSPALVDRLRLIVQPQPVESPAAPAAMLPILETHA